MSALGLLSQIPWILGVLSGSIGDHEVTRRDFPFVDPSRCRQPDFCGLSSEWDLKFGRVESVDIE